MCLSRPTALSGFQSDWAFSRIGLSVGLGCRSDWGVGRVEVCFCLLSLQNSVRKNFRFSSFFSFRRGRKGLTAVGRYMVADRFSLRRVPARPLRLFQNEENSVFQLADFVLKRYCFFPVRPSRDCGGGLVVMQRQPRCNAAEAPLHPREGLTGTNPRSSQREEETSLFVSGWE